MRRSAGRSWKRLNERVRLVDDPGMVSRPTASLQRLGAVVAAPWVDPRRLCGGRGVRVPCDRPGEDRSRSRRWKHRSCRYWPRPTRRVGPGRSWQERFAQFTAPNWQGPSTRILRHSTWAHARSPSCLPTFGVRRGWLDGSESVPFDLSRHHGAADRPDRRARRDGRRLRRGRHPRHVETPRTAVPPDHAERACRAGRRDAGRRSGGLKTGGLGRARLASPRWNSGIRYRPPRTATIWQRGEPDGRPSTGRSASPSTSPSRIEGELPSTWACRS